MDTTQGIERYIDLYRKAFEQPRHLDRFNRLMAEAHAVRTDALLEPGVAASLIRPVLCATRPVDRWAACAFLIGIDEDAIGPTWQDLARHDESPVGRAAAFWLDMRFPSGAGRTSAPAEPEIQVFILHGGSPWEDGWQPPPAAIEPQSEGGQPELVALPPIRGWQNDSPRFATAALGTTRYLIVDLTPYGIVAQPTATIRFENCCHYREGIEGDWLAALLFEKDTCRDEHFWIGAVRNSPHVPPHHRNALQHFVLPMETETVEIIATAFDVSYTDLDFGSAIGQAAHELRRQTRAA